MRKIHFIVRLVVALFAVIIGFSTQTFAIDAWLKGQIINEIKDPVQGALIFVTINDDYAKVIDLKTDKQGYYRVRMSVKPEDKIDIAVGHPYYVKQNLKGVVIKAPETRFDLQLKFTPKGLLRATYGEPDKKLTRDSQDGYYEVWYYFKRSVYYEFDSKLETAEPVATGEF